MQVVCKETTDKMCFDFMLTFVKIVFNLLYHSAF